MGEEEIIPVSWNVIWATVSVAVGQSMGFYLFFLIQRAREKSKGSYSMFEPRQYNNEDVYFDDDDDGGDDRDDDDDDDDDDVESTEFSDDETNHQIQNDNSNKKDNITRRSRMTRQSMGNSSQHLYRRRQRTSVNGRVRRISTTNNAGVASHQPKPYAKFWWKAAWDVTQEELLESIGLDAYMYLRLARLGTRTTAMGMLLSFVLIPIYATGSNDSESATEFNRFTIIRIDKTDNEESRRLWSSAICWCIFVCYFLYEVGNEWKLFSINRGSYLAIAICRNAKKSLSSSQTNGGCRGGSSSNNSNTDNHDRNDDDDIENDIRFLRYAIQVENLPPKLRSNGALRAYFEGIFPNKVLQAVVHCNVSDLQILIDERQSVIEKLEKVIAYMKAKPEKPRPTVIIDGSGYGWFWPSFCVGDEQKKDAIKYYTMEIERLNKKIDEKRSKILSEAYQEDISASRLNHDNAFNIANVVTPAAAAAATPTTTTRRRRAHGTTEKVEPNNNDDDDYGNNARRDHDYEGGNDCYKDEVLEFSSRMSSTGVVTFTSLLAKQASVQCELSHYIDTINASEAIDPDTIIWKNITVSAECQHRYKIQVACVWVGALIFWSVPLSFLTSFDNAVRLAMWLGIEKDPNSFIYSAAEGLFPVTVLVLVQELVRATIAAVGEHYVKLKTFADIDAYTLKWYQLFLFANIWFVIIGGSKIDRLKELVNKDFGKILSLIANSLVAESNFFVSYITVTGLGQVGFELSQLYYHGVELLERIFYFNRSLLTQRQIDISKIPPAIQWCYHVPTIIFVFLIAFLYMAIVPVMQFFACLYFAVTYIVFKHQFLHVYNPKFETGGDITWYNIFRKLISCLYASEIIFIFYMSIMEGMYQALFSFVPLALTILFHSTTLRKVRRLGKNLCLQGAAEADATYGDLTIRNKSGSNNNNNGRTKKYITNDDDDDDEDKMIHLDAMEDNWHAQPALKFNRDERGPMPYRRHRYSHSHQQNQQRQHEQHQNKKHNNRQLSAIPEV